MVIVRRLHRRTVRFVLSGCLVTTLTSPVVAITGAQQATGLVTENGRQAALMAASLKPGDKIQLMTVGGAKNLITGKFSYLTDSELVINHSGREVAIRFDDIAFLDRVPSPWPKALTAAAYISGSLVVGRLLQGHW